MLNKDKTPRQYAHIDPENMPTTEKPPYQGTRAQCLADALLDVIQVSMETGLTTDDIDQAMAIVTEMLAQQERHRFRLHVKNDPDKT